AIDGLSLFFKLLFIAGAAFAVAGCAQSKEIPPDRRTEYCALIVASTLAMSLVASATDCLLAFLALQFMNVLGSVLAGYGKREVLSTEAAVKFMAFGVLSAALFLYGLAILFAATHTLNMTEMHKVLLVTPLSREMMLVAFLLIFLSLSFQFSAFPMYLWAPDVLEGAPTPVSAFLGFGPRAAGFALAIRMFIVIFAQPTLTGQGQWQTLGSVDWTNIVAVVAGLTMALGSLMAFRQNGAKRLLACLVVAETGFLLLGLLVLDEVGIASLLYHLVTELFAISGSYFVLSFFFDELHSDRLEDLRGMLKRAVPECICLILFLLCLVGVPPLPGFIGKFALIGSAVRHQRPVLALIAILSIAISAAAVAKLSFSLVGDFRKSPGAMIAPNGTRNLFLMSLVVPMFLTGVFANFVLNWAGRSLGFILW
ncbi:MAG: NADH-quinone oxidoreductase subunit N, partial [Bdellovibrionota bacterium]